MNILGLLENGLFALGQVLRFPVMTLLWVCVGTALFMAGSSLVEFLARRRERGGFEIHAWLRSGPVLGSNDVRRKRLPSELRSLIADVERVRAEGALADGGLEHLVLTREERVRRKLVNPRMLVKVGPSLGLLGTLIPMGASLASLASGNLEAMAGQMVVADDPHQVSQSGRGAYEASLTATRAGFALAWYDTRDGHPEIYMRLVDARGEPAGPERRLTNQADRAYEAAIAAIGDNLAVAWYEVSANRTSHAMIGVWTPDGQRLWSKPLAPPERISRNPVVRTVGQEIFVAWLAENAARDFEVYAAWFDRKGNLLAAPQRLGPAGETTWNVNATIDDQRRAWVVFDARVDTRRDELYVARVDRVTSQVTRVTADDGFASKYPDLAVGGGRVALTWFDERDGNKEVYLFVGNENDLKGALDARAARITNTPGESLGAYVAWNAKRRRFGLAWCDNSEGQHEIYFEPFDTQGRPIGVTRRLTRNGTDSLIPAIRPTGDGFSLVWNEYTPAKKGTHESDDDRSEVAFAFVQ